MADDARLPLAGLAAVGARFAVQLSGGSACHLLEVGGCSTRVDLSVDDWSLVQDMIDLLPTHSTERK